MWMGNRGMRFGKIGATRSFSVLMSGKGYGESFKGEAE